MSKIQGIFALFVLFAFVHQIKTAPNPGEPELKFTTSQFATGMVDKLAEISKTGIVNMQNASDTVEDKIKILAGKVAEVLKLPNLNLTKEAQSASSTVVPSELSKLISLVPSTEAPQSEPQQSTVEPAAAS